MSKENIERFINQISGSQDLQARIGTGMEGEALAALGAENGYDFSVEELSGLGELSDQELEGVAGGAAYIKFDGVRGGYLRGEARVFPKVEMSSKQLGKGRRYIWKYNCRDFSGNV